MKLLYISVLGILINGMFGSIDRGSFLELNLAPEKSYMLTTDCVNVHICKTHRKDSNFFWF